ncbi:hypothetical protein YPPY72_2738, partial [Yersinia pestis PY-72]
MNYNAV